MAVTDADFGEMQKQMQALSTEVALLKRSSSWWHQFSSTALPIVITLLITVFGATALQNSRFESMESRLAVVEADGKQLLAAQAALQKDVTLLRQDVAAFKQAVEALGQGMGSLQAEVKDIKNLLAANRGRGR